MKMRKLTFVAVSALLAAAILGAVATPAAAQQQTQQTTITMSVQLNDKPIKPLSGSNTMSGTVNYEYPGTGQSEFLGTQIQFTVADKPSWAVVTVIPNTLVIPVSAEGTPAAQQTITKSASFQVQITTTADAPAYTPGTIRIQANAQKNGNLNPANNFVAFPVQADYFSIINARTDTPIQTARPQQQVAYPITVQNLGNAETKVFFKVAEGSSERLTIAPPPPSTLQARQNGGKQTQDTFNVQIQTPYQNGYLNEVGSATIDISSNYAFDTNTKGDSSSVTILNTTKGFYVPGLSPLLFIGLLGVAGLLMRRARRE